MAKVFGNSDDERKAIVAWIESSKTVPGSTSLNFCSITDPVKQIIDVGTPPQSKEVTISESKAVAAGLLKGDMFNLLGCYYSNPQAVFQRIGSKIIYAAILQQSLTPEERVKFNLTTTNPTFHSSDPDKQFYVERAYKVIDITDRLKHNWENASSDPQYIMIKKTVDDAVQNIRTIFNNSLPITTVDQAKRAGQNMSVTTNKLYSDIRALNGGTSNYVNKVNGTLIDLQELTRTIAEIMEGKVIPASANITLGQIPNNLFTSRTENGGGTPALNQPTSNRSGATATATFAPTRANLMLLLSHKVKPKDFFIALAADKVETALDLPENSLVYFVTNYEDKGLNKIDSFYAAVGQAKVEQVFNMPAEYFQGWAINDAKLGKPDFRNDMRALRIWGADAVNAAVPPTVVQGDSGPQKAMAASSGTPTLTSGSTIKYDRNEEWTNSERSDNDQPYNTDGSIKSPLTETQKKNLKNDYTENQLLTLKLTNKNTFDSIVAKADKQYQDDIQAFINSLSIRNADLETSFIDVADNVEINKLNDSIRTPEQDLLFRLGITGSLSALQSNNIVAWAGANARTEQIDKLLGLGSGSTRALITDNNLPSNSIDKLTQKEKQLLVAKMKISPTALDKLLKVMSGQILPSELGQLALDVTNIGDNPYIDVSAPAGQTDECMTSYEQIDGMIVSNSFLPNGWFYFDKDSTISNNTHVFGSKNQAEEYSIQHIDRRVTYLDELAYGLANLLGINSPTEQELNSIKEEMSLYANGNNDDMLLVSELSEDEYKEIYGRTGVSQDLLDRIFIRSDASDVNRPLVAYKKAVGQVVVKKVITSKVFGSLGVRIDP
ncbi:MAG: hypothetical protein PHU23_19605, partial [Dehalococcoidales bacterium]|nr:hypothetical protein [Dehalococcoidales bacterium]